MLYKIDEWTNATGEIRVQCNDLVGTGRNWDEPAKLLQIKKADFVRKLRLDYGAVLTVYRKSDGSINFIDYHWTDLRLARKFKNFINAESRKQKYQI